MKAYHFLKADMKSAEGNEPPWTVGETRTLEGEIIPCERGYHASPTSFDALRHAPGPVLCLVELDDEAIPHGNPVDKYVARCRTLLKAVNIERELHLFAADCAERGLPFYEAAFPGDDRPRAAIQAARDFVDGRIDDATLAAAAEAGTAAAADTAAWAAADTAAWAAADTAAWAAKSAAWAADTAAWAAKSAVWAAKSAAWAAKSAVWAAAWAAKSAVWAAAWAAADTAAWAAADTAAKSAAWEAREAAWAAEHRWQRERFNALCAEVLA